MLEFGFYETVPPISNIMEGQSGQCSRVRCCNSGRRSNSSFLNCSNWRSVNLNIASLLNDWLSNIPIHPTVDCISAHRRKLRNLLCVDFWTAAGVLSTETLTKVLRTEGRLFRSSPMSWLRIFFSDKLAYSWLEKYQLRKEDLECIHFPS